MTTPSTLQDRIEAQALAFAYQLLRTVRGARLGELLELGRAGRRRGRPRGSRNKART